MLSLALHHQPPSTGANKELIRDLYIDVYQNENLEILNEIVSPNFTSNDWPESLIGPDGFKKYYDTLKKVFPFLNIEVKDLIAENNQIIVLWKMIGKRSNGQEISESGMTNYKVENGFLMEREVFKFR